jgi:hypothetical protein
LTHHTTNDNKLQIEIKDLLGKEHTGIRNPPSMPYLAEEDPAFLVYRIDNWLPRFDLLLSPNSWSVSVALCCVRHPCGLRYQKVSFGCSLGVVLLEADRCGTLPFDLCLVRGARTTVKQTQPMRKLQ